MLKIKLLLKLVLVTVLIMPFGSCKKPAGPGGKASIKGKVYATDWDNQQRFVISRGYAVDERVYIMYGDHDFIDDDVRTSPDGTFEFRYLNKGKYKVFVNSIDTTTHLKGVDTYSSIIANVEITGTSETKTVPDFYINR
jgi:hypothetical protein